MPEEPIYFIHQISGFGCVKSDAISNIFYYEELVNYPETSETLGELNQRTIEFSGETTVESGYSLVEHQLEFIVSACPRIIKITYESEATTTINDANSANYQAYANTSVEVITDVSPGNDFFSDIATDFETTNAVIFEIVHHDYIGPCIGSFIIVFTTEHDRDFGDSMTISYLHRCTIEQIPA